MSDRWRRHLEETGEPWHLLADGGGRKPWLAEAGGTTWFGAFRANVVVAYGAEPGPWVKVGTWDGGYAGTDPGPDVRAENAKVNVADRLVLAAAEVPEGEAFRDRASVEGRLDAARAALTPWAPTELRIDGDIHAALLTSSGHHQILFTTETDRCIFVQSSHLPAPTELVTCTDLALLDALRPV